MKAITPYILRMNTVAQLEASIQRLPAGDFFTLLDWMAERHLEVLATGDFEAPELETALLAAIDSPRHKLNDPLLEGVRALSARINA